MTSARYTVTVTSSGFGEVKKTNVVVNANQVSTVNAELAAGGQQITIDVISEAGAALQTEAPVRGGNISQTQIVELPIALRNPVALALTLPGVSTNRFGFGRATFSANGGRGRSNNFLIDGTENNDISIAGQGFQITNPDAVQEVSIQTGNYDAEFGRAGGAVVNTITKSGTNNFHGTLSYLLDSTADDAITNTQSLSPDIQQRGRPPFGIEQWFSGTFGGPLYLPRFGEGGPALWSGKDRTFFFVAYQQQRQRSNSSLNVVSLSPAGRATLRSLFPTGTNPRVDNYLAVTSAVDATSGFFTQNLSTGAPIQFGRALVEFGQRFTEPQFQLRIDHKIGDNDQLAGRFLYSDQNVPAGNAATGLPGFFTSNVNEFRNFWLSETHVFSPSLTNELRIAYNRLVFDFPLDPENPLGLTLPSTVIAGITNLAGAATPIGIAANFPQGRIANNYVIQDTMTHVRGDHTFRFGTDLLLQRSKQFAPINQRGQVTYNASGSFSAFANYVDDFAGSGGGATRDFGSPLYYPELFRQAYFFQDRWRAQRVADAHARPPLRELRHADQQPPHAGLHRPLQRRSGDARRALRRPEHRQARQQQLRADLRRRLRSFVQQGRPRLPRRGAPHGLPRRLSSRLRLVLQQHRLERRDLLAQPRLDGDAHLDRQQHDPARDADYFGPPADSGARPHPTRHAERAR